MGDAILYTIGLSEWNFNLQDLYINSTCGSSIEELREKSFINNFGLHALASTVNYRPKERHGRRKKENRPYSYVREGKTKGIFSDLADERE
jgi:hypothetical protein